ncbi:macro domain-containing protein [Sunxiuqinia rutila]|uniref:macro domain-containing protein n=1 Tax=Sunxiuqinia rutila TaxID=1397841 RepID=UPI003D36D5E9
MNGSKKISDICIAIPTLAELFKARVRHYTIEQHTLNVLNQFEKYFSRNFCEIEVEVFQLFLLLHDIGKPIAYKNDNRSNQYEETINIISEYRQDLNISNEGFLLFKALLSTDSLGMYMQGKKSLNEAYKNIVKQSEVSGLSQKSFFYLLSVYYQCDVASYTEDAGGLKFLEHLFAYQGGNKLYDKESKLLRFSDNYQQRYSLLMDRITNSEKSKQKVIAATKTSQIKFLKGNIFNSKAQVIVNTVNCVGVMGKGVALVFKLRYPNMFGIYQDYCKQKYIGIGKLWLYKEEKDAPWVLNFPTKFHWKYPSKIEYIEKGLIKFVETYREKDIKSIAFPLLGTHNGGLDRQEVLNLMTKYLGSCTNLSIEIYEYDPSSPDDLFESFKLKWNAISPTDKKITTGIRTQKQIETLDNAINSPQIKSMISLIDCKGIGIKTMEKCFNLVMRSRVNNKLF